MSNSPKAIVILSPGFEEIEAVTVIDVLRRAKIDVTTASLEDNKRVCGSHNIPIEADTSIGALDAASFNVLILPGGMRGVENMLASDCLLSLARDMDSRGAFLAAVCAAPLVYDRLGLLSGLRFTCHPCVWDRVSHAPEDVPSVVDGRVVTGRSAGCAMAWSLALVEKLLGSLQDGLLKGLCQP